MLSLLLAAVMTVTAQAAEPQFLFALSVNGETETKADRGDVVTVTLRLTCADGGDYTMYAMQDEVVYDPAFFQPVQEGILTAEGVQTADVATGDGHRACTFSYVSFDSGTTWPEDVTAAIFQFRVIGESGASILENRNYLVSHQDGYRAYDASAVDVSVVVSELCTVRFETNGGSVLPEQTVRRGQTLAVPDEPVRERYRLAGWFTDAALTQPWDFAHDVVTANMTLYAAWEADASETAGGAAPWYWLAVLPLAAGAALYAHKRHKAA